MAKSRGENCDWCGAEVLEDDGFRLLKPKHSLAATFCRLEHVVPWLMATPDWHIREGVTVPEGVSAVCAQTGQELDDNALYLVHHRDEHRISDGFIDADAVLEWAKAGGRWGQK